MEIMEFWTGADIAFTVIFLVSLLIMLYAMALMSRAINLLQYRVSVIEKNLKLMEEEFKMIANRDAVDLSKIKAPPKNDRGQVVT